MEHIKALIIDDNILERRVLSNVLKSFNGVEVRILSDFEDAYSIIGNESFDVVFLSVEESRSIPKINLDMLQYKYPSLLVVVTAKRTESGARSILNALKKGAVDFVTKPDKSNMLLLASNHFKKRLGLVIENIREIKFSKRRQVKISSVRKANHQEVGIVVIGTGSEGVKTLHSIFDNIPEILSVPVLVVPHLPKIITKVLADSLNHTSRLEIMEAIDGVELKAGTVCIVPGGFHAEVIRGDTEYSLRLHRGPRENGVRPSINGVFRSVSRIFGENALGVMLSGYGQDGFVGAQLIKEYDGEIWIQKPDLLFAGALLYDIYDAGLSDQVCSEEFLRWEILKKSAS